MGKMLAGVAVGVFVGAMVVEIVRRTNPNILNRAQARIKEGVRAAKDAFMEGYMGAELV